MEGTGAPSLRHASVPSGLAEYLRALPEEISSYQASEFWARRISQSDERTLKSDSSTAGFEALPEGIGRLADDPEFAQAKRLAKRMRRTARRLSPPSARADKTSYEHMRALSFLRAEKLLEEYEAFLEPRRVRSSMAIARFFVYMGVIERLVDEHLESRPLDILEIGAGSSRLACFLAWAGHVRNYTVVELPERIVEGSMTVHRGVEGARIHYNEVPRRGRDESPQFWFMTPRVLDEVPAGSFDVCLNFNSFMEMDEEARDRYIAAVYRTARPGAVFYNVNRRQRGLPQRDGGRFDNNPLLFPYDAGDRILFWEEDAFQQVTRSNFHKIPTLAIARAALVNLPGE